MGSFKYCLVSGYNTGQGNDQVEVVFESFEEVSKEYKSLVEENKKAKDNGRWNEPWMWHELYEMKSIELPEIH